MSENAIEHSDHWLRYKARRKRRRYTVLLKLRSHFEQILLSTQPVLLCKSILIATLFPVEPRQPFYFLTNPDFYRRIYSNGLITIKAGPLLDIARANALTSGPAARRWYVDAGAQARFTVLGTSVVLTWGHDLRSGSNAFYGTAVAH